MVSAEGGKGNDDMRRCLVSERLSHYLLLDRTNYFQRRGWFRLADGFKGLDCTFVEIPQDDRYRVEVAWRHAVSSSFLASLPEISSQTQTHVEYGDHPSFSDACFYARYIRCLVAAIV